MKKIALSMIAALAIFSVSCSKSDSKDDTCDSTKTEATKGNDAKAQVKEIVTKAISEVKANPANAENIFMSFQQQMQALGNTLSDQQKQECENDPELTKLMEEFQAACSAAQNNAPAEEEVVEGEIVEQEVPTVEEAPAM